MMMLITKIFKNNYIKKFDFNFNQEENFKIFALNKT